MSAQASLMQENISRIFTIQEQRIVGLRQTGASLRIRKLQAIRSWIKAHRREIRQALYDDFRKPVAEADLWEIVVVIKEIRYTIRHLRRWMKPKRIPRDLLFLHARSYITYESRGRVLIIAPWNFPFQLAMGSFISALAAGNCIILKPSELAPHTAQILKKLVADLFPPDEAIVLEGDKEVAAELLKYPFDHIFFTGGTEIGKKVMRAASDHLASVSLELGGKCPAIVDKSADLKDSVKKIAWGKFSNAGQTCVAPDYVIVAHEIFDRFLEALVSEIKKNYICGESGEETGFNGFGSIIDENHFQRLARLLQDARQKGADVVLGGQFDRKLRCIEPTVLTGIDPDARIMREEIFGPILPVLAFDQIDQAIEIVNRNPHPLGIYFFSKDKRSFQKVVRHTVSGGTCLNDLVVQFVHDGLPFGGAGDSGIGRAHGFAGFKEFSNERTMMIGNKFDPIKLIFPPITPVKQKIIEILYKYF